MEKGWPSKGFEIQVNNTYMKDPVKTGSLYHVSDVKESFAKDDEWFTEHIVVQGDTITIKVNDKQTVQWTQPKEWAGSPDFANRVMKAGHGRAPGARSEQHGLLQEHPRQAAQVEPRARDDHEQRVAGPIG